ncbi:3-oxoacyl-acp reductase [Plakobranchus ocellatus]|uniref:3-oxoacyl-acp reductase n=1 Tax=Plakobranchus ocellatus TaxID=259542 RepID=A0AAV3ZHD2_9GAST|nr:3-oxoacyl-acp reductase [Plakobranchus ocellatus]
MSQRSAPSSADSLNRFVGKVAIVTGSSSGLGATVALRLAREGARVTLTGRDENKLKATAQGFAANMGPLQPMHGKCATADEFSDALLYLLSDAAKFITGQALLTDGGISLVGALSNIPL